MNAASGAGFLVFATCGVAMVAQELGYRRIARVAMLVAFYGTAALLALLATEGP